MCSSQVTLPHLACNNQNSIEPRLKELPPSSTLKTGMSMFGAGLQVHETHGVTAAFEPQCSVVYCRFCAVPACCIASFSCVGGQELVAKTEAEAASKCVTCDV